MIISLKKRFLLIISAGLLCGAALGLPVPAAAELTYRLTGYDRLAIGEPIVRSAVAYDGFEYLRIVRNPGDAKRLYVDADLTVRENGASRRLYAHATETVGVDRDAVNVADDPLNLTLLAQPFGVQLERGILAEIGRLRAPMPYVSRSPLTGGDLTGSLRHGVDGVIDGYDVLVLRFESRGPLGAAAAGGRADAHGDVRMQGTACYRRTDGLLLKLDTLLTIVGHTGPAVAPHAIAIAYKRTIRVYGQARPIPVAYHVLETKRTVAARPGP